MIPTPTTAARAARVALASPDTSNLRDFDTVADLQAELRNANDTGNWRHIDVLARTDHDIHDSIVVATQVRILAVVAANAWELIAVGRFP